MAASVHPSGVPTPCPAPEGGAVRTAGRARELAATSRSQPQTLERISASDPVKGVLRRASPALDSAPQRSQPHGLTVAACLAADGWFHTKRHRPYTQPNVWTLT